MFGPHGRLGALCCLALLPGMLLFYGGCGPAAPAAAEPRLVPMPRPRPQDCGPLPRADGMWFGFAKGMGLGVGQQAVAQLPGIQDALGELACLSEQGIFPTLLTKLVMVDMQATRADVRLRMSDGSEADMSLVRGPQGWRPVQPVTFATTPKKPSP